ncbi:biotin operon repressor [Paenibacillus harenae]|nr:biotin operon repressor [Paenibacillus harenae]
MNKTDRLLAIVLELQGRQVVRAEDLAALFETSVRTIYRDIQALSEAGVPITGTTGTGYTLMEGYFLPPISFTIEEAVTLLIGTEFIEQRFDDDYRDRANVARRKIEVTLSDSVRSETSRIRRSLRLLAPGKHAAPSNERKNLDKIRRALLGERSDFIIKKELRIPRGAAIANVPPLPMALYSLKDLGCLWHGVIYAKTSAISGCPEWLNLSNWTNDSNSRRILT